MKYIMKPDTAYFDLVSRNYPPVLSRTQPSQE